MIVVNAGMPKAGTAWFHQMITELVIASGGVSGCDVRDRYGLGELLKTRNATLSALTASGLSSLLDAHLDGLSFTVKTHAAPSEALRDLLASGVARATWIYRDPRDCMVSALEHGVRLRIKEQYHANFACLYTAEDALRDWRGVFLPYWLRWMQTRGVVKVRYEELVDDPAPILKGIATYLGLDTPEAVIDGIVARNHSAKVKADTGHAARMHLNQGRAGRFRAILSAEEQSRWDETLTPFLKAMGYPVGEIVDDDNPGLSLHLARAQAEFRVRWAARQRPGGPGGYTSPSPTAPTGSAGVAID